LRKPKGALGKKCPFFPDIALTKNFLYKGGPKELLPVRDYFRISILHLVELYAWSKFLYREKEIEVLTAKS